jgi:hypothetical protein
MFAITLLFAFAALFAFGTIAHGLPRFGRHALALRGELAACPERREVRFQVIELRPSNVVALPFRPRAFRQPEELRAAA